MLQNYLASLLYKSLVILRNTTTEIWQPVWPFFVQNSGYTKLHKALSSLSLLTTCIKSVDDNLHQVCSSQLASSLQFTTCIKSAVHNLHQVCSSQLASSLQFTNCIKPAVHNLHQVCSSQLASSLQFTTCSKPAVHNLHQVCSSQLAASLLTTCNRLDIIKPEQAMRTHPDIGLMIASCIKSAADLLQLARFWLCMF